MALEEINVSIIPADGTGEEHIIDQVPISPGDTAADIIEMLGRSPDDFFLAPLNGRAFQKTDVVYPRVANGDMLAITPDMEAGLFGTGSKKEAGAEAPVSAKRAASGVNMLGRVFAHQKGWEEKPIGVFHGVLATPFGPLKARISCFSGGKVRNIEIHNPPREIWQAKHPHKVCFLARGENWYELHMIDAPRTVDEAILNAERTINEAYLILHGGDQAPRFRAQIEAKAIEAYSRHSRRPATPIRNGQIRDANIADPEIDRILREADAKLTLGDIFRWGRD